MEQKMSKPYLGCRVGDTREGVAVADQSGSCRQLLEDLFLHFPTVGSEHQMDSFIRILKVFVLQVLIQGLPAHTLTIYKYSRSLFSCYILM